jgi:hypothetical protein
MSYISPDREAAAEETIRNYVLNQAALAIYDPLQFRRPKAEVLSFEIEMLDFDDDVVHAAGPVRLRGASGEVEQFLRVSVPLVFDGDSCRVPEGAQVRAAYIVETDHPNGGCKETVALANA